MESTSSDPSRKALASKLRAALPEGACWLVTLKFADEIFPRAGMAVARRFLLGLLSVLPWPTSLRYAAAFGYKDVNSLWLSHVHLLVWFDGVDSADLRRRAAVLYHSGGRHAHVKVLDDDGDEPYDYLAGQAVQTATWETGDYRLLRDYAVHHALVANNDGSTPDDLAAWLQNDGIDFSAWEKDAAAAVAKSLHRMYARRLAHAVKGGRWHISSEDALASPVAGRQPPRLDSSTDRPKLRPTSRKGRAVQALGELIQALARRSEVAMAELWADAHSFGYPYGKNTFYKDMRRLRNADILWFRPVRSRSNRTYHLWQVRGGVDLTDPLPAITAALYGDEVRPPKRPPPKPQRRRRPRADLHTQVTRQRRGVVLISKPSSAMDGTSGKSGRTSGDSMDKQDQQVRDLADVVAEDEDGMTIDELIEALNRRYPPKEANLDPQPRGEGERAHG